MKKGLLSIALVSGWLCSFAQAKFEAGYYIGNDGQRTNCQIKNEDWASNPTSFEFRLGEGEPQGKTISDVSEFGFSDGTVFRRFEVDIDRTSDDVAKMTIERNPQFKRETLFLRIIQPGKAILYGYEDRTLKRFFYQLDQGPVSQLVYLRYLATTGVQHVQTGYAEANNLYKQQLLNALQCADLKQSDFENLKYERSSLVKLFRKYNACQGDAQEPVVVEKPSTTHVTPKIGLGYNGFWLKDGNNAFKEYTTDRAIAFRFAAEIEFVVRGNNGRWSFLFEPAFQSYSSQNTDGSLKLNYSAVDLGVGVRYYFRQEDSKAFYAGVGGVFSLPLSSKDALKLNNLGFELSQSVNATASLGYRINRLTAEVYYGFGRGLMGQYVNYSSGYSGPGIMIGYRIK